jgi:hypothetical protein
MDALGLGPVEWALLGVLAVLLFARPLVRLLAVRRG